jgi:hypothetical protein
VNERFERPCDDIAAGTAVPPRLECEELDDETVTHLSAREVLKVADRRCNVPQALG